MRRYLVRLVVFLFTFGLAVGLAMLWRVTTSRTISLESGVSLLNTRHDPCNEYGSRVNESSVVVFIASDHEIYIGKDKVTFDEVTNKVRNLLKYKCERLVFVKVSDSVRYRTLDSIVGEIRKAEVDGIGFVSNKKKVR